jgi:phage shock protein C
MMADKPKKLYRSKNDRWLAGVCGGLAEYFNIDAILVRVLFILFGFAIGGSILIYIILWIVIPEAPDGSAAVAGDDDSGKAAEEPAPEAKAESAAEEAPAEEAESSAGEE